MALYNFDPVETTGFSILFYLSNKVIALLFYLDLSLRAGDQISVLEKVGEWWKGSCRGKSGIFPANYVQKVQGETAAVAATNPPAAAVTPAEMVGRAIADFTATAANQVSLKAGDLVRVHNTSPGINLSKLKILDYIL